VTLADLIDRAEQRGVEGVYEMAVQHRLGAKDRGRLARHLRRIDSDARDLLAAVGDGQPTLSDLGRSLDWTPHRVRVTVEDLLNRGALRRRDKTDADRHVRYIRRRTVGSWRLSRDQRDDLILGLIEAGVPARKIIDMAATTHATITRLRETGSKPVDSGPAKGSLEPRQRCGFAPPAIPRCPGSCRAPFGRWRGGRLARPRAARRDNGADAEDGPSAGHAASAVRAP
jgi:hypothetical protein